MCSLCPLFLFMATDARTAFLKWYTTSSISSARLDIKMMSNQLKTQQLIPVCAQVDLIIDNADLLIRERLGVSQIVKEFRRVKGLDG